MSLIRDKRKPAVKLAKLRTKWGLELSHLCRADGTAGLRRSKGNAGIGKRTDRGHVGLLVVGMMCRLTSDIRFYSFGSNIEVGPIDSAMLATLCLQPIPYSWQ